MHSITPIAAADAFAISEDSGVRTTCVRECIGVRAHV
jgi:hypothetical protein